MLVSRHYDEDTIQDEFLTKWYNDPSVNLQSSAWNVTWFLCSKASIFLHREQGNLKEDTLATYNSKIENKRIGLSIFMRIFLKPGSAIHCLTKKTLNRTMPKDQKIYKIDARGEVWGRNTMHLKADPFTT